MKQNYCLFALSEQATRRAIKPQKRSSANDHTTQYNGQCNFLGVLDDTLTFSSQTAFLDRYAMGRARYAAVQL